MASPVPLYTADNCKPAYQLRWSLAIFPTTPLPALDVHLDVLREATERDHVRILEMSQRENGVVHFLLSTTPAVAPPAIVKSVKGRLIHILRSYQTATFRRNFRLTSVGDVKCSLVEKYVASQLEHHPVASAQTHAVLAKFQKSFHTSIDDPVNSAHGQYVTCLHLVMVHAERWRVADEVHLQNSFDTVLAVAVKKQHALSRIAVLPDHIHLVLRMHYEQSPEEVALSYMNNIAFCHGQNRLWMNGYYVGTIGKYDIGATRCRD